MGLLPTREVAEGIGVTKNISQSVQEAVVICSHEYSPLQHSQGQELKCQMIPSEQTQKQLIHHQVKLPGRNILIEALNFSDKSQSLFVQLTVVSLGW